MEKQVKEEVVEKVRARIKAKSEESYTEVEDLIKTCRKELELKGVYGDESDPTYYQAVVLYCKANYGYDEGTEKFQKAFEGLRDSMALSGEYKKRVQE